MIDGGEIYCGWQKDVGREEKLKVDGDSGDEGE